MDNYTEQPATDEESDAFDVDQAPPPGLSREDFNRAYARDSADYADAVLAGRSAEFVPTVGFHTTTPENYSNDGEGVAYTGLDPMRGGIGGASEAAGEGQTFADGSDDYVDDSRGHVYYAGHLDSAEKYTNVYGEAAKDATVLGVNLEHPRTDDERRLDAYDLAGYTTAPHRDPADEDEDGDYDDEYRTRGAIPPQGIVDLGHIDDILVHSPDPDIAGEAQERIDDR